MAIAILDPDKEMVNVLSQVIEDIGQKPAGFSDKGKFLDIINPKSHNIAIISDVFKDVVEGVKEVYPEIELIAIGQGDGKNLIRVGATCYLKKPFKVEDIQQTIIVLLKGPKGDRAQLREEFVMADPKMMDILKIISKVAPTQAPVFIQGESGTGKEVIARYIHNHSKRAKGAYIGINLAALPDNLIESELFGFEKGAFTGAYTTRIGKFEQAHEGTVLLDEITEISPALQAKLLRVLQERQIDRIGGKGPINVDFRVISTTNRDIDKYIKEGKFRRDLYFRLNVIPINIPPLRSRKPDIIPLAVHFIRKVALREGMEEKILSEGAKKALLDYSWPGNVRELENALERAMILTDDTEITESCIMVGMEASLPDSLPRAGLTINEMERHLILSTLESVGWNRTKAASLLGISIRTLRNKLNEYKEKGQNFDTQGVKTSNNKILYP
ncbi:MAG: sigma-54-dependent Fis family transcriptional regulator [Deltaproteobacteria bacterium]|nr:sigma-54-dependent Fis family transcriptional regulator [Deltaproteobacteria bacterium]